MEFFRFEIARRLRQPMVWIFLGVNFLLILGALNSDSITVGGSLPNVNANAPWVVQQQVMIMTLIGLLVTTAFMNTAAVRDFATKFDGLLFTKPISKFGYLAGRFFGAVLMACVPLLGVLLAVYITGFDPFGSVKVGPTVWAAYPWAILLFIIPNTLFAGAITFAVASLTRSQVAGFVAALGLLVLYIVAGNLLSNLDSEFTAAMLDPFGFRAFGLETKYWTAVERNSEYLTLGHSTVALNRLLWVSISLLIAALAFWRWSFAPRAGRRQRKQVATVAAPSHTPLGTVAAGAAQALPQPTGDASSLATLGYAVRQEVRAVLTSRVFLVIMAFAILNMLGAIFNVDESYGTGNYPVTYLMVDAIRGSLYLFLGAVVMYYAGELVWRERDAHIAELFDASPVATWVAPVAKFIALCLVPLIVLAASVLIGAGVQLIKGYSDVDLGQYVTQLLAIDWLLFVSLAGLALFLQALLNNKYIAYFAFLVILIGLEFGLGALGVVNNLFNFGTTPSTTFTAFNGLAPYIGTTVAYSGYWLLFTLVLVAGATLLWVRGRGHTRANRAQLVGQRFDGSLKFMSLGLLAATLAAGSYIYYQTSVVNEVLSEDETEQQQIDYERRYGRFNPATPAGRSKPQPSITSADYDIELYPEQRRVEATIAVTLHNTHEAAIDTLLLTLTQHFTHEFELAGATLIEPLSDRYAQVYALAQPIAPGASVQATVRSKYAAKGIENEVSFTSVVPNGSFVNSNDLMPTFGYNQAYELSDRDDREKHGLSPKPRLPKLPDGPCEELCRYTYLTQDADWVKLSATVTTSPDQIAVAPGSLVSESTDEATGRRTFRYELEQPVLHFFSVVSGRYEVDRERWGEVDLEVYYLPEHQFNVDKMMSSMRTSLSYYSEAFGPYQHRQARIIEFPRYASFAQAFPGTMPYSESIGFIADLKDSTDIDMVTYVVAHEMAHQWWAHQVIGAGVQGATMLSETFAQYSALLVQEQYYGRASMRKFLDYELDRYLRGRGQEREAERPLMLDEGQGYIHYRKGAVVMYALAEYIGRDSLNAALGSFVDRFAGQGPPYPTTRQFVDEHLRPRVPDSLQYVVDDWFETITLYDNRVLSASAKTRDDGRYDVSFTVSTKKLRADSLGTETPVALSGDYIDVGVFAAAREDADDRELGEALWRERVRFTADGERTFTVTVDAEPAEVAIDPGLLLIDRLTKDNREKVEVE